MMWGFYAWQPYFLELLGRDAVWVSGLVSALIALATIAGNGVVEFVGHLCTRRTTVLFASTVVLAAGAVGVGVVDSFWPAVALLLVAIGAMGGARPVQQAYVHGVVPSAERATVVSFMSMVGSGGGIAGPIGLGYLSQTQSVATGYVVGGFDHAARAPADRDAASPGRAGRRDHRPANRQAGSLRGSGPSRCRRHRHDPRQPDRSLSRAPERFDPAYRSCASILCGAGAAAKRRLRGLGAIGDSLLRPVCAEPRGREADAFRGLGAIGDSLLRILGLAQRGAAAKRTP